MSPVEYYYNAFPSHLALVMGGPPRQGQRLSLITFAGAPAPGDFGEAQRRFHSLQGRDKSRFLFCLHFSALIDQTIHASSPPLHFDFDRVAGYPKVCGILGSYGTNLHPAGLLRVATLYVEASAVWETELLRELSAFFVGDYRRFVLDEFPQHTNLLDEKGAPQRALDVILAGAREAYTPARVAHVRESWFPFNTGPQPDHVLYERWLTVVRGALAESAP